MECQMILYLNSEGRVIFVPPMNRNASIKTYCRLVQQDVDKLLQKKNDCKHWHNITKEEKRALDDLQRDNEIVIKVVDKGGAIVVQDRDNY